MFSHLISLPVLFWPLFVLCAWCSVLLPLVLFPWLSAPVLFPSGVITYLCSFSFPFFFVGGLFNSVSHQFVFLLFPGLPGLSLSPVGLFWTVAHDWSVFGSPLPHSSTSQRLSCNFIFKVVLSNSIPGLKRSIANKQYLEVLSLRNGKKIQ